MNKKKWILLIGAVIFVILLLMSGFLKETAIMLAALGAGAGYKHASEKVVLKSEEIKQTIKNAEDCGKKADEEVEKIEKETAVATIAELIDYANNRNSRSGGKNTTIR